MVGIIQGLPLLILSLGCEVRYQHVSKKLKELIQCTCTIDKYVESKKKHQ